MTFLDLEWPKRNLAGKNCFMEQQLGFFFSLSFTFVHTYLTVYNGKFDIHYRPSRLLGTVTAVTARHS